MKIFVTGATGFIGKHFLERLAKENYKVVALTRGGKTLDDLKIPNTKVIIGDITEPKTYVKELNSCHTLVHLAAIRSNWGARDEFFKVNSDVIKNFFVPHSSLKHIVVISSVYVLGIPDKIPANEKSPFKSFGIYGESKIKAEELTIRLGGKYKIPYTIIRPAIVYGPGDNELGMVTKMISLFNKNKFAIIGNGNNLLHLIYVDDLVDGIVRAIRKNGNNSTYILAGPSPITLLKLSTLIKTHLHINSHDIFLPKDLVYLASYFIETFYQIGFHLLPTLFAKEPPLSRIKVDTLIGNYYYDISKAKKELNFCPQVNYNQGIKKTVEWFKSQTHKID